MSQKILAIAFTLFAFSNAYGQARCDIVFNEKGELITDSKQVAHPATYFDAEILQKVKDWKARIALYENSDTRKWVKVEGEISDYAADLVRKHENEKFFFLASQIEFSLNKIPYEDYQGFFYYGSSMLEAAVLSKNYEVYKRLRGLAKEFNWSLVQDIYINVWNQPLTAAFRDDKIFSKDALLIKSRQGKEFDPKVADFGMLTPRIRRKLADIKKSGSLRDLVKVLGNIFPTGRVAAVGEKQSSAELSVVGEKDWFHAEIYDSSRFKNGVFNSWYTKKLGFNLLSVIYKGGKKLFDGNYYYVEPKEFNWIRDLDIRDDSVRILVERDKDGKAYDRTTTYQEITFALSKEGRIEKVTIKNGEFIVTKLAWSTQTIVIPSGSRSFSGVAFDGEEDLSTTDLSR